MATLIKADPTFYPSARLAMQAPPETVAYVVIVNPGDGLDGFGVVDADRSSKDLRPAAQHADDAECRR